MSVAIQPPRAPTGSRAGPADRHTELGATLARDDGDIR